MTFGSLSKANTDNMLFSVTSLSSLFQCMHAPGCIFNDLPALGVWAYSLVLL